MYNIFFCYHIVSRYKSTDGLRDVFLLFFSDRFLVVFFAIRIQNLNKRRGSGRRDSGR